MTPSPTGRGPRRLSTLGVLTPIVMRRRAATLVSVLMTGAMWCLLGWLIARGALARCVVSTLCQDSAAGRNRAM
jgi:hypothetical protein